MSLSNKITLTERDAERLASLVSLYADVEADAAAALQKELDRASVVTPSKVAPSIVTMGSRIVCRDATGALRELEVVYPRKAYAAAGRISVLAPLGRALLGAAVGDRIEVTASGRVREWTIEAIRYQPEAAGDWHL